MSKLGGSLVLLPGFFVLLSCAITYHMTHWGAYKNSNTKVP